MVHVVSIEESEPVEVYDITVDVDSSFIVHGVVLHNCPACMSLDGKVFPINEGPRPPRHVACRCTMNVVLKSAQELGLNLREIPEGTRMSMDGQVPQSVIYNDWL